MNGTYGNRCYCSLFTRQRRGPVNPWIRTYWNINARYRRTRKNKVENWVRYRPVARKQRLFACMNKTRRTRLFHLHVLPTKGALTYVEKFLLKKVSFQWLVVTFLLYISVSMIFVKISSQIFILLYLNVINLKREK